MLIVNSQLCVLIQFWWRLSTSSSHMRLFIAIVCVERRNDCVNQHTYMFTRWRSMTMMMTNHVISSYGIILPIFKLYIHIFMCGVVRVPLSLAKIYNTQIYCWFPFRAHAFHIYYKLYTRSNKFTSLFNLLNMFFFFENAVARTAAAQSSSLLYVIHTTLK